MKTSEKVDQFNAALAEAQGEMPRLAKDKTAEVTTRTGKDYSFGYIDLASIIHAVRPVLAKFKLAVAQGPGFEDGKAVLFTRLTHGSGQWMESAYPMAFNGGPQERGSEITYARRYALCGMLGIAAEEDDDGNRAAGNQARITQRQQPQQRQPKPPPSVGSDGDQLADNERFISAVDEAFLRKGFQPSEAGKAVAKACQMAKKPRLTDLPLTHRHRFLVAVADGKFDDVKAPQPA